AGVVGVEGRVARGYGDVERLGRAGAAGQVEVVVEELAPDVEVRGEVAVVVRVGGGVGGQGIADGAGAGAVGAGRGRHAVGVGGGGDAEQGLVRAAPVGVGEVVAGAVERAVGGNVQQAARFERFEFGPGAVSRRGLRPRPDVRP